MYTDSQTMQDFKEVYKNLGSKEMNSASKSHGNQPQNRRQQHNTSIPNIPVLTHSKQISIVSETAVKLPQTSKTVIENPIIASSNPMIDQSTTAAEIYGGAKSQHQST